MVDSKTRQRLTLLHKTENINQLRVACSEKTFTAFCGCCGIILHLITGNLKISSTCKYVKDNCLLSVYLLCKKCFQDG
jgi:hypothetical protein